MTQDEGLEPLSEVSENNTLTPLAEKQIDFYGDVITAALVKVEGARSQIYVPLRPLCEYLGLDWSAQFRRTKRDEVLSDSLSSVAIMATEVGSGKGRRQVICIRIEQLPGWLFGITTSKVRPELEEKIKRYRRECFAILWRAFESEAENLAANISYDQTHPISVLDDYDAAAAELQKHQETQGPSAGEMALLQIRENMLAMAELAEQQLRIEREVRLAHNRLDSARDFVRMLQKRIGNNEHLLDEVDNRLRVVEDRLSPSHAYITDDQGADIALSVKALAELLTRKVSKDINSKKPQSQYSTIFAELYRRFAVSSYKLIKLEQYPVVLQFLADWKKAADDNVSNEVFLQGKLF